MKERPILFSGPMARAILDGRKTQTRRIVKPQPEDPPAGWYPDAYNKTQDWCFWGPRKTPDAGRCTLPLFRCPYGQPGDRLWVRETWGLMNPRDTTDWFSESIVGIPRSEILEDYVLEHASNWRLPHESAYWRPSIHMPRWASRITLEIEFVRVERLQEISEEDAEAEGATPEVSCYTSDDNLHGYRYGFETLRNLINGPGSWDLNPWVWVVQFKRVEAK